MRPRAWPPVLLATVALATALALVPPALGEHGRGQGGAGAPTDVPPPGPTASTAPAAACPGGMVLVEGTYCTEVEQRCRVGWYARENRKRVCEEFEPESRCVGRLEAKRFCVDRHEWPNREGARPEVMNTFYQAQVKCAAAGKRLCTESEWTMACEGPQRLPFPHGYVRDPRRCNGDHRWDAPDLAGIARRDPTELARLWRGVPSGSQDCVSAYGVADLPGNVDEVVASESPRSPFASAHTGGPWYSGVRNQCRPKVRTHREDFYYHDLGFRCCAEPDGTPSAPLTLRQRKDGLSWQDVEREAGLDVATARRVLDLAAQGACRCDGPDAPALALLPDPVRCRTACGTLLGPGAKDGDDTTRLLHPSRAKVGAPRGRQGRGQPHPR